DAGFEPAVLPWLSHALLETWKRRRGRILTFSGYAEAGGLRGAIVHKATAIYQQFNEQEQHIARNVFMRLTKLGEGTQDSRRRAPLDEIIPPDPNSDPMLLSVLQMLAKARLIVVSDDGMHAAHEAIVRDWTLLRSWVEENRDGLRIHRVLADDAANWVHLGHDRGALYRGVKLGQALEWAEQHPQDLNTIERSFLETARDVVEQEHKAQEEAQRRQLETAQKLAESERQRAEEQEAVAVQQQHTAERMRRSAQRLAVLFGVAGILAIVALIAFYFAGQNRELADQKQRTTRARELSAIAQRLIPDYPQRSLLLAVEAYNTLLEDDPRVPEVEEALRLSLAGAGGRSLPFESSLTSIENPITAVAISSDEKWLVAGAENGEVYLWDRTNLELPPIVLSHDYEAKVLDVVIGPESSWMYTSIEGNAVYQWDLYNLEFPPLPLLSSNENEYQLSLAVNDKWLIGGGENGNLSVWIL
ncbi:MAG: hypothetical protein KDE51_02450, partial [Anaerolineales bacterium]|nr:hypothetical protein [Anaerolineales bacterium]